MCIRDSHWSVVDGDDASFYPALKGALVLASGDDDAWVSLGWGKGQMAGTECAISERGGDARKYAISSKKKSGIDSMGAQTLRDATTTVGGGEYVVEFVKSLREAGENVVGGDKFVWAFGSGSLGYHGADVGVLELDLETCASSVESLDRVNSKAIRAHGGLLVAAFAAAMPLAITSAKARFVRPPGDGLWLKAHIFFNVAALVLGVSGVAVAFGVGKG